MTTPGPAKKTAAAPAAKPAVKKAAAATAKKVAVEVETIVKDAVESPVVAAEIDKIAKAGWLAIEPKIAAAFGGGVLGTIVAYGSQVAGWHWAGGQTVGAAVAGGLAVVAGYLKRSA